MFRRLNAYDRAMLGMKDRLLVLSELVVKQLHQAMDSFLNQDGILAKAVIHGDDAIDELEAALEMEAMELISIQQPVDQDLRFLAAIMRISRELERISDYACDIAEATLGLNDKGKWIQPLSDLPHMAELVYTMLAKSLKAYREKDLTLAGQLDTDDDQVDRLYAAIYQELAQLMKTNPDNVDQGLNILLIVRYLERVGDHVVNIAEMAIFVETGARHPFRVKAESNQ